MEIERIPRKSISEIAREGYRRALEEDEKIFKFIQGLGDLAGQMLLKKDMAYGRDMLGQIGD